MRRMVVIAILLPAGCSTDLGECDEEAARAVVYDEEGLPAYEGQALVQVSCGNGSFCHAARARGEARYGAPAGLDFDVALAGASEASVARLANGKRNVEEWAQEIYGEVERGTMPPWGEATLVPHANLPRFRRVAADGTVERLPHVDSFEGLGILKNWLACGAPVVERTEGTTTVGDVVPALR